MLRTSAAILIVFFVAAQISFTATTATITETTVPTSNSQPWGITVGPDSAIWFTEGAKIGRMTTSGSFTEFPLPSTSYPNAIATGSDGALWFGETTSNVVGRITTSGTVKEYTTPNGAGSMIAGIVSGPDGALWFTETDANMIGRITTSGAITEYKLPSGTGPWLIVVGPDNAMWFTENTMIGRITTSGVITEYPVPTSNSYPWGIAVGGDGALWFTEERGGKVGRITTSGIVTEFPISTTGNDLSGITRGGDGSLWFSDNGASKVAQITTAGVVTEFPIPTTGGGLRLLTLGPDSSTIWFTEQLGNKIGKLVPGGGGTTCTYSLGSTSANVAAGASTGTVTVTSGTGCTWTASSNASWITVTGGASGTGNGTVAYSIAANTGSARSGTITIAGQAFTISQASGSGGGTSPNLIVNGDAESGSAGGYAGLPSIPGWTTDGNAAVITYSDGTDGITPTSPGPTNRGNNYFAGGPANGLAQMTQTIDLSSYTSAIDAGLQHYTLDGWIGGYDGQDDNAVLTITFQSSSGSTVGTASIGPVLSADRNNASGMIEQTATGTVPPGTRKALVTLKFTRLSGSDNDGAADNLYFGMGGGTTSCTYTLGSTSQSVAATASTLNVSVTAGSGCTWTASSNSSWITVTSGAAGTGNGSVALQIAANSGGSRTGTVTIAGQTFTVTQAGATSGCSYNVNPTDIHVTAAASSGTMIIFTNSSCTWSASVPTGVNWITLSPSSGTGQGAVGYSISANSGAARSTTLTVAGTAVTVEQDAGTGTCSYSISNTSALVPGLGGAGAVLVTVTGSNCAPWTVSTPSVSWVHLTSPASSTATGTVSYYVDPNTGTGQRNTTLTIAGQTYTITEDVPPCIYTLSASATSTLSSSGASGSVQITASSNVCPWSVAVPATAPWVHVTSALSAAGSGVIAYRVDPNPTTASRNAVLTINGQKPPTAMTYAINQAGGSSNTGPVPVIDPGGVVNSASFISANLQAGALAQGSFFSIFGNNLGPDVSQKASTYPLQTTLGGVSVKVTQGSTSVPAYPIFVAPFLINAVMPSNAPTGTVQVTVTYGGNSSPPMTAQVVPTNFASFSVSGGRGPGIVQNWVSPTQVPLNTASITAAPGDVVILWGTGLGPLPNGQSDAQPPPGGQLGVGVQVMVGNATIKPDYAGRAPGLAGVDQINFTLPASVTQGCYVPVQITAAGMSSNTVTMAVAANRQACSDTNPLGSTARSGGKNATIVLSRLTFTDASKAGSGSLDLGIGVFEQQSSGGDLGFDLYASMPPRNSCTYYNNLNSVYSVLVGGMPSTGAASLDAGSTISVTGPNGARAFSYSDASAKVSPYFSLMGASGSVASSGLTSDPPFLDPGTYRVSGNGGKDVGAFSFPLTVSSGATWTNRDQITSVTRSQGLTITWSGGNPSTQVGVILGLAGNPANSTSGGFACLVTFDQQSFTVPPGMMANLPPTTGSSSGGMQGGLLFLTFPSGDQFTKFTTSGTPALDSGMAMSVTGDLRSNIAYK